jgi:hypothetical protein
VPARSMGFRLIPGLSREWARRLPQGARPVNSGAGQFGGRSVWRRGFPVVWSANRRGEMRGAGRAPRRSHLSAER